MADEKTYISKIKLPNDQTTYYIKADIANFTGATEQEAGTTGLVPAPSIEDKDKFLKADGTWTTVSSVNYSAGTGINISDDGVISLDIDNGDIIQY